ncbi:hypothetical protein IWW36_000351 [Coemansia brasiliensis]|uniref:MIF4G domain-containing protein n=1 Tax=Coemansia brasiliensis TaxID=2650707 RepID=A0A9W8IBG7_9FUNG|nr:hypothetical protein IWW36_000351 [Coemansia brasiliensis]
MSIEATTIQPTNSGNLVTSRKKGNQRGANKQKTGQIPTKEQSRADKPKNSQEAIPFSNGVRFPKQVTPIEGAASVRFGSLQATQQQQRPPVIRRQGSGRHNRKNKTQFFYPQSNVSPMMYPMGYPPMLPGQMPMYMHMQNWFPGMPPHMAMSQPSGYSHYYPVPSASGGTAMASSASQATHSNANSVASQAPVNVADGLKTTAMPIGEIRGHMNFTPFIPKQTVNSQLGDTSSEEKPLFKLPVKKVIRIVNPNDVKKPESRDSADCVNNAEKKIDNDSGAAVNGEAKKNNDELKQEGSAGSESDKQGVAGPEPAKQDVAGSEPAKQDVAESASKHAAESASEQTVAESVDKPPKTKQTDVIELPDSKNDIKLQLPTVPESTEVPSENTSEEPTEAIPKLLSSKTLRILGSHEVVAKYATAANPPRIVDEILKYPQEFMLQFNEKCNAPEDLDLEGITTWSMILERSSSGMHRSPSTHARQRDADPATEFGRMGQFRRSNTDSIRSSEEWVGRNTLGNRDRFSNNKMGGRSMSGRRFERNGERSSRQGRGNARYGAGSLRNEPSHTEAPVNVKPLVKSSTGFVPRALRKGKDTVEDEMDEKVYRRRILVLLNKLTPDNFDAVSDEMVAWGDKSAKQTDGSILRALVELVVEKASDEPKWIKMYGNLCLKLIYKTSNNVKDHQVRMNSGEFMAGGVLVRKYLLHKCQNDFERGWKVESTAVEQTDAFYEAVKIKRRGLGLVELIGELFLLDVLTTDIIKSCLRRLLSNIKDPQEESLESMMKLLTTVGKKLDVPSNKEEVNLYFSRIRSMTTNKNLDSRIRLLLMNMIDLRARSWKLRNQTDAPTTITELHQQLEREKVSKRPDPKTRSMASANHRNRHSSAGGRNAEVHSVGDLSHFGNLSRTNQRPSGNGANPFSALAGGSRGWRTNVSGTESPRPPALNSRASSQSSRSFGSGTSTPDTASSQNMFNALMSESEDEDEEAAESKAQDSSNAPMAGDTKEQIKKGIEHLVATGDHMKLRQTFVDTAEQQRAFYLTIDCAMDCRPDNLELVVQHINQLALDNVISDNSAIDALAEFSEQLEDLVLDVPNALRFFGMLMAAARVPLSRVHEALGELASKLDSSRPPASAIVFAYLKQLVKFKGPSETQKNIEEEGFDMAQFMCVDRRSSDDVKRALQLQDLLDLFPKYRDDDALASFTNFGTDGIDADTASLFGSFTNDGMQASSNNVFGQLSVNDLSGFGVDLNTIDMGNVGGDGGMDLSSIQLMNLDEIPPSSGNMGQSMPSTDDAAQMMAHLLNTTVPSTLPVAAAQLGSQPPVIASIASSQPVSTAAEQPGKKQKSRSSSQSSSEMGDIPLAQLALLQQGSAVQHTPQGAMAPQGMVGTASQPASVPMPPGAPSISLAASMYSNPPAQSFATANILGMSQPANLQTLINSTGMNPASMERLMPGHPQLQQQQAIQGQAIVQQALNMPPQSIGMARTEEALAPNQLTSMPNTNSTMPECGTSGVESTVFSKPSLTTQPSADLSLELARPSCNLDATPLDELEQIESQLCLLLSIASRAIRMISGSAASAQAGDQGNAQLESTVREFMEMVAKVHADLRFQHKKLVARGIPIQVVAGYRSDTAGFERDLISWSDAADLLATALHSGLKLSDTNA